MRVPRWPFRRSTGKSPDWNSRGIARLMDPVDPADSLVQLVRYLGHKHGYVAEIRGHGSGPDQWIEVIYGDGFRLSTNPAELRSCPRHIFHILRLPKWGYNGTGSAYLDCVLRECGFSQHAADLRDEFVLEAFVGAARS